MSAVISKILFGILGFILISAIGIWLFWEESAGWFKRSYNRSSEPGLIFAAIFSN